MKHASFTALNHKDLEANAAGIRPKFTSDSGMIACKATVGFPKPEEQAGVVNSRKDQTVSDTPEISPEAVERLIVWLMDAHETGNTEKNPEAWRTLEALSAERDALKAELAEAVGLMQDMRDHGANDYVIDRVLGFLARHRKETDT